MFKRSSKPQTSGQLYRPKPEISDYGMFNKASERQSEMGQLGTGKKIDFSRNKRHGSVGDEVKPAAKLSEPSARTNLDGDAYVVLKASGEKSVVSAYGSKAKLSQDKP